MKRIIRRETSIGRKRRIKLLFFNFSLEIGGIERLLFDFCQTLDPKRYSVEVCVLKGGGKLEKIFRVHNIPVVVLEKKRGIDWSLPVRISRIVKVRKVDIIHAHNFAPWLYAALSLFFKHSARLIVTMHSYNVVTLKRALAMLALTSLTHKVVTVSEDVKRKMAFIGQNNIQVIYNGIDVEKFRPDSQKRVVLRKKFGIDAEKVVVGFVGRTAKVKNLSMLIRAFSRVQLQRPYLHLLIVGDGPEMPNLRFLAKEKKISSNISFLGERDDISDLLNVMDIFVLPSLSEGHNLSLLEAMATGVPPVATAVGGNVEIINHQEDGLLVPVGQENHLVGAISSLAGDYDLRQNLGKNARKKVVRHFSKTSMLSKYQKLYENLVE